MYYSQEAFMENYFVSQRENIFRNVEVLIYVFDVESQDGELKKDLKYYQTCLSAIYENSPSAKVFCLIHKMDLIQEDQRDKVFLLHIKLSQINLFLYFIFITILQFQIFLERENEIINMSKPIVCNCFKTSIWDETLYGVTNTFSTFYYSFDS